MTPPALADYNAAVAYDLKIINGILIDGTGRARYRGDIAVKDDRIVAVGEVDGAAERTIDAEGALVTPGFTDIHTHYDGQVSWDADLMPSCLHGVTTVVFGNCGVGFAPVRAADRDTLIALMEGVEDIPGAALSEGIQWRWESFPEYLDALDDHDGHAHTIDFAAQVPHDALRVYVMGERAVANAPATDDDIRAMRDVVRQALEAGAVGFSTGRTDNHRSASGDPTPASEATARELEGIAEAFHGFDHGVLQAVSDFDMARGDDRFDPEFDVLERMAAASDGHATSLSLMQRDPSPNQWKWILSRVEQANQRGVHMRVQVASRGIGVMLGLNATFHPFMGFPSYKAISHLPLAERVARMRDEAFERRMLSETTDKVSGQGSSIPPMVDQLLANIDKVALRLYRLGEEPDYEPALGDCLYNQAIQQKQTVLETIYHAMLEQDGHALLYFPLFNYSQLNLDNVHTMLTHPLALPGLSDGGAHVGTVCDASFPTFLLTHWARDRERGRLPLEQVIKMQAHDTARFVGFRDRGALAPGLKADINIIDFERLRLHAPRMHADLPAGGKRLLQGATGYRATIVSGRVVVQDGQLTGQRPGRLVRGGRLAAG